MGHPPSARSADSPVTGARFDRLCAIAAGAAALAVYVRTLAPGLVAVLDTPMFQFIGKVLGVAHNPGYPLYVLLTYPISLLPLGSLPYRINAFSSILAALTVSLVYLIARRLGCRRTVSAAAALGLAFGQVFWSQAVIAEVYALHAAIVAGALLALLAWRHTRREGYFFAAVAVFAAGLGNHTTIVALAPGMAAYAWISDRPFATRLKTLAVSAAILSAGLLQYGFILIRSHQAGAYVESPARTVGDLLAVMSGRQFRDRLFAFEWQTVVRDRLPSLLEHVLAPELTIPGLLLAIVGAVWLLRRRLAEGLLLLPVVAITAGFAANYRVVDTPVFLIPGILVLWLAAAVGAEQTARLAGRVPWAGAACGMAVLMLPVWNLTHNFAASDRSRDTRAATEFDALFHALPARTVLVHEDFLIDRMVMFELLGEQSAKGREIELAPVDPEGLRRRMEEGFEVFAFRNSGRRLRHGALNVSYEALSLTDGTLAQFLLGLDDGMVVAVAVPGTHAEQFAASAGASFASIGGPRELARRAASNLAIAGLRGARDGAVVRAGPAAIEMGARAGTAPPFVEKIPGATIQIRSDRGEAAIRRGSRDVVRTADGAAVAVWTPEGKLAHAFVLQAKDAFRVRIATGPLSVYPVRGLWPGDDLPVDRWANISNTGRTGSVMLRAQPGASAVVYVSDDAPLLPRVIDRSSNRSRVEITPFEGAPGALRGSMAADDVRAAALEERDSVYRIEVRAPGAEPVSVLLALGGVPDIAIGRATRSTSSNPCTVFSVDTTGLLRTPDDSSEVLLMARDEQAQLTGHGWSPVDSDAIGSYRWMTAAEARLLLPVAGRAPGRIRMQALLEGAAGPSTVRLRMNRTELPAQPVREGWQAYEWALSPDVLPPGTNEAVVIVDRLSARPGAGGGTKGLAVSEVRVLHPPR